MSLPAEPAPSDPHHSSGEAEGRNLVLAVDIGKSSTYAAVGWRSKPESTGSAKAAHEVTEIIALEEENQATPSALYVDEQGYLLTGELARDGAVTAPERLITGFHHRIGDETPIVINSGQFSPESLSVVLLEWIIELVSQQLGTKPGMKKSSAYLDTSITSLVVTHPGEWGAYRKELLWNALHDSFTAVLDAASETPSEERTISLIPQPIAAVQGFFGDPPMDGAIIGVWEPDPTGSSLFLVKMVAPGNGRILAHQVIPPADSVEDLIHHGVAGLSELARLIKINPGNLLGTVVHGSWSTIPAFAETAQARFPSRVLVHPESASVAARGAAMPSQDPRAKNSLPDLPEHPVEQTVVLPRLSLVRKAPQEEQPERPPVSVTPFSPSQRQNGRSAGKKWFRRRKNSATLLLIPVLTLGMVIGLPGQLAHSADSKFTKTSVLSQSKAVQGGNQA